MFWTDFGKWLNERLSEIAHVKHALKTVKCPECGVELKNGLVSYDDDEDEFYIECEVCKTEFRASEIHVQ